MLKWIMVVVLMPFVLVSYLMDVVGVVGDFIVSRTENAIGDALDMIKSVTDRVDNILFKDTDA